MTDKELINQVEQYLNNSDAKIKCEITSDFNPIISYKCNVVKRLVVAYENTFISNIYDKDFVLALRQFLLVMNARIKCAKYSPTWEKFGIKIDSESGLIYCDFSIPDYLDDAFVKAAFLYDYEQHELTQSSNLVTDPLIYNKLGIKYYRSLAQKLAVYGALKTPDGYTTLVCLPTGGGKSTITHAISVLNEKLSVVIVPTVSLAIDQERVAKERLVKAGLNQDDVDAMVFEYHSGRNINPIIDGIKRKTARLLFISPEALTKNALFSETINDACKIKYLDNLIIDEAHIVFDWGDSFRIDYQCLEPWRKKLIKRNPLLKTFLLSATFEDKCVKLLKEFFSEDQKWIEIRCDELRKEPKFINVFATSRFDKFSKITKMVDLLPHPMIVYVQTPDEADEIKFLLNKNGLNNIALFTGDTPNSEREKLIKDWSNNQFEIMVATSAFGIGVDKPDVRTVLHTYLPSNANAFYQELGRGGRDGLPCLSITCLNMDFDSKRAINKKIISSEKLYGRWLSMYKNGEWTGNSVYVDTSIRPTYMNVDILDEDERPTEKNIKWNIHCLLFLRRNGLIRINELKYDINSSNYYFSVEILEEKLRYADENLLFLLTNLREKEKEYQTSAIMTLKRNLADKKICISEMFNETYGLTDEYCAGCRSHHNVIKSISTLPLKTVLNVSRQRNGSLEEIIIIRNEKPRVSVFSNLISKGVDLIVSNRDCKEIVEGCGSLDNLLIIDYSTFYKLIEKGHTYFLGESIALEYDSNSSIVYEQLRKYLLYVKKIFVGKVYHVIDENIEFDELNKSFSDYIN